MAFQLACWTPGAKDSEDGERERDIVKCLAFNHFYIFKLHILYLCIVHVHAQKDKGEFW